MLRTLVLTILLTFTANSAFALTAKEIVTQGKVLASGGDGTANRLWMTVHYKKEVYQCMAHPNILQCYKINKDIVK